MSYWEQRDVTTLFLLLIWTGSVLRFFLLVTGSLPLTPRWREVIEAVHLVLYGIGFVGLLGSLLYHLLFN